MIISDGLFYVAWISRIFFVELAGLAKEVKSLLVMNFFK